MTNSGKELPQSPGLFYSAPISPTEAMTAFDSLPRELRDMFNYAPVSFNPVTTYNALMRGRSAEFLGEKVKAMIEEFLRVAGIEKINKGMEIEL